jgi:tetratricopeptide (TPR) repeat protein
MRYASDSARTWNIFSSAMTLLQKPAKAVSAARNAVELAQRDLTREPSVPNRLDLAVYQYVLASALGESDESLTLLIDITQSLDSPAFALLRGEVARAEHFEIYSTPRGDVAAYVSLVNRSHLRLAKLYESRGDEARARQQYEAVLAARSDDATALAALGHSAEAFEANPFSESLIREYRKYLRTHDEKVEGTTTGAQMRRALAQIEHGELRDARETLDALAKAFPANETIRDLQRETDVLTAPPSFLGKHEVIDPSARDLRSTIDFFDNMTAEQRQALDAITFTSTVMFDKPFESGTIDGVPFTFSEPMRFNGAFDATKPLRLTYRILGATRGALLLEPVRLQ